MQEGVCDLFDYFSAGYSHVPGLVIQFGVKLTYLSLLDRLERGENENPSIGIILCAEKDHVDVELTLEGMTKPIGVADYQLIIPKEDIQKLISEEIKSFEDESKEQ